MAEGIAFRHFYKGEFMEELMKALCIAWKEEWQGMVMGVLRYSRGEGDTHGLCKVSCSGRRIVRVRVTKGTADMSILLFPPSENAGKERNGQGSLWCWFSAEEVRSFSFSLGDHNAIHQTLRPVVSGFQIALALAEGKNFNTFHIRFHHPLYAGEAVYLKKEGKTIYGFSRVLCFEAVIE